MKKEKQVYFRPSCLGWYSPCSECDGDEKHAGEPAGAACAAKDGCVMLLNFIGGVELRDESTVRATLDRWPSHKLVDYLTGEIEVIREKEEAAIRKQTSYRPTAEKFNLSLTVVDFVVEYFARKLKREIVDSEVSYKKKNTIYLRWHANGDAILREVRRGVGKDRTVAKFKLHRDSATCNLKVYTGDFEAAYSLEPPRGVACRIWRDGKTDRVVLVGVDAQSARDAGTWLARCVRSEIIGKQL